MLSSYRKLRVENAKISYDKEAAHLTATEKRNIQLAIDHCKKNGLKACTVGKMTIHLDFNTGKGRIKNPHNQGYEWGGKKIISETDFFFNARC